MPGAIFQAMAAQGFGPAQTAASWTLTTDNNNGVAMYAFRVNIAMGTTGKQIRATFVASNSGALVCTHASVGTTATAPSTVATPKEFKFSGASGFSLSAGQSITSDWLDFDVNSGDHVVIDMDLTTTNLRQLNSASGADSYFKAGATDYATASVSGYSSSLGIASSINLVEVRK